MKTFLYLQFHQDISSLLGDPLKYLSIQCYQDSALGRRDRHPHPLVRLSNERDMFQLGIILQDGP